MRDAYRNPPIVALEGLESVRMRPRMYVGPTDDPLLANALLKEALCCTRDDALSGRCTQASVHLREGGTALVRDDGPGLPLDVTPSGRRRAEDYLLSLHACANAKAPAMATTTCTFGLAVLNALSSAMRLRIFQDGTEWRQSYERGAPTSKLEPIGPTSERGTELLFTLDETILKAPVFSLDELATWARSAVVQLRLPLVDELSGREIVVED